MKRSSNLNFFMKAPSSQIRWKILVKNPQISIFTIKRMATITLTMHHPITWKLGKNAREWGKHLHRVEQKDKTNQLKC